MRIGIDFDNTIIRYDEVFVAEAQKQGLVTSSWCGGKLKLRDFLREQRGGEIAWQSLQGLYKRACEKDGTMIHQSANPAFLMVPCGFADDDNETWHVIINERTLCGKMALTADETMYLTSYDGWTTMCANPQCRTCRICRDKTHDA